MLRTICQFRRRTWFLLGLFMAGALGVAGILAVGIAFFPWHWLGPWPSQVAELMGATEAEVRAELGNPDLVLGSQAELDVLTFILKSFSYKWVAGRQPARTGWIRAEELPPVSEKAYWYNSKFWEYLTRASPATRK